MFSLVDVNKCVGWSIRVLFRNIIISITKLLFLMEIDPFRYSDIRDILFDSSSDVSELVDKNYCQHVRPLIGLYWAINCNLFIVLLSL